MTKKINAFLKNAHTKRENKQKQRQLEKKMAIILKCERVVLLPPLLKNNVLCIFCFCFVKRAGHSKRSRGNFETQTDRSTDREKQILYYNPN